MPVRSFFTIILLISFFCPGSLSAKSALPHEFGKQVPLYPSAQAVETQYTRDSVSVRFSTDDTYEGVSGFYAKALEDAGWQILPDTAVGVIKAEKVAPGKNGIELTLKEVSSNESHPSSFIIDLYFPGGRE